MIMRVAVRPGLRVPGCLLRREDAADHRDARNPPGIVLGFDPAMLCHICRTRLGADHQQRLAVIIDGHRFQPVCPAQRLFYGASELLACLLLRSKH